MIWLVLIVGVVIAVVISSQGSKVKETIEKQASAAATEALLNQRCSALVDYLSRTPQTPPLEGMGQAEMFNHVHTAATLVLKERSELADVNKGLAALVVVTIVAWLFAANGAGNWVVIVALVLSGLTGWGIAERQSYKPDVKEAAIASRFGLEPDRLRLVVEGLNKS